MVVALILLGTVAGVAFAALVIASIRRAVRAWRDLTRSLP